jgi:hypothetical protein
MKYWEVIADKLSASGWSWGVRLRLIRLVASFSQQTRTATTKEIRVPMPVKRDRENSVRKLGMRLLDELL